MPPVAAAVDERGELGAHVVGGRSREDLLARINLWTFRLPALAERGEDIEPNVELELDEAARALGVRVTFSCEARQRLLASTRLPPGGRIDTGTVDEELARHGSSWRAQPDLD